MIYIISSDWALGTGKIYWICTIPVRTLATPLIVILSIKILYILLSARDKIYLNIPEVKQVGSLIKNYIKLATLKFKMRLFLDSCLCHQWNMII